MIAPKRINSHKERRAARTFGVAYSALFGFATTWAVLALLDGYPWPWSLAWAVIAVVSAVGSYRFGRLVYVYDIEQQEARR